MNYDGARICGVADNLGNVSCQWPFRDVNVFAAGRIGSVNLADAMELSLPAWNNVCGIRLSMTTNLKTAHIAVGVGRIDGPGSILAQNQLPCGFTANNWRQLRGEYDASEAFVIAENPPPNRIDLVRVCAHETGHGIGINHIGDGNLMAPSYSGRIALPQNGDIVEARARYGAPTAAPQPPTVPPEAPGLPGFDVQTVLGALLKIGMEFFANMPAEQKAAIFAWLWRQLMPTDRKILAEALRLDPDDTELYAGDES